MSQLLEPKPATLDLWNMKVKPSRQQTEWSNFNLDGQKAKPPAVALY